MNKLLARLRESGDPRIDYLVKLVELSACCRRECMRDKVDPRADTLVRAVSYVIGLLLDDMVTQRDYKKGPTH